FLDRDGSVLPPVGLDLVANDDALAGDRPAVRSELKEVLVAVQPLSINERGVAAVRQVEQLDAIATDQGVEILEVHLRAGVRLVGERGDRHLDRGYRSRRGIDQDRLDHHRVTSLRRRIVRAHRSLAIPSTSLTIRRRKSVSLILMNAATSL